METLEKQIDEFEKKRISWLLVNLIGFILWDGFRIIENYLINGKVNPLFQLFIFLGWLIWVLGFVQLVRLSKKVRKIKQAQQILNDELVELNRLKSLRFALIVVALVQVSIIALSVFAVDITGVLAAEVSVFAVVTSVLSAFVYYDKRLANG